MKKNYDLIDFWKLFFAVSVVALHTGAFRDFSPEISFVLFSLISRLAVPFFFCAGGFFLFSKWSNSDTLQFQLAKKQAKRVLILYGVWTCIKLLYYVGRATLQGNAPIAVLLSYLMDVITLNDGPYWYLQVQVIMTLLLGFFCNSERKTYVATAFFGIGYLFFMILEHTSPDGSIPVLLDWKTFFDANAYFFKLCVGGLFLSIGGCVSYWKQKAVSPDLKKLLIGLVCGMALLILEIGFVFYVGRTDYDKISYFFALPLIATFLLQLSLSVPVVFKQANLWRNLSILIYVTHYITRGLVGFLAGISYFLYFLVTLAISVVVGLVILKLSEKYRAFRWLY